MLDIDSIFTLILCAVVCCGFALSYKEILMERVGMPDSAFRQKVLSRLLGAAAVLIWFGCCHLAVHFDETRPTVADELSGQIYPINNHGHVVFLTLAEQWGLFSLGFVAAACFISGYLLDRKVRRRLTGSERSKLAQ